LPGNIFEELQTRAVGLFIDRSNLHWDRKLTNHKTMKDKSNDFSQTILKGQPIPTDLQKLLEIQCSRSSQANDLDPLASMGMRIVEPEVLPHLLTHSYLNENDRANADLMANIRAIDEVFKLIIFVAEAEDGEIFGYWLEDKNSTVLTAPLVKFDTEGQFAILRGASLTEALIGDFVRDDEQEFLKFREWFAKFDILVSPSLNMLHVPTVEIHPSQLHTNTYHRNLIDLGHLE
jgi:hypothetical protein